MQEKALKMLKGLAGEWQEINQSVRARAGKSYTATTFLLVHVRLFRVSVIRGSEVCGLTVFCVGVHLLYQKSANIPRRKPLVGELTRRFKETTSS